MACNEENKKVEDTLPPREQGKDQELVSMPTQQSKKNFRTLGEFGLHVFKENEVIDEPSSINKNLQDIEIPQSDSKDVQDIEVPQSDSKNIQDITIASDTQNKQIDNISIPGSIQNKISPTIQETKPTSKQNKIVDETSTNNKKQDAIIQEPRPKQKSESIVNTDIDTKLIDKDNEIINVDGILRNSKGEPVVELGDHIYKGSADIGLTESHKDKNEISVLNEIENGKKTELNIANIKSLLSKEELAIKDAAKLKKSEQQVPDPELSQIKSEEEIKTGNHISKNENDINTPNQHDEKDGIEIPGSSIHEEKEYNEIDKNSNLISTHKEKLIDSDASYYDAQNEVINNTQTSNNKLNYTYEEVLEAILTSIQTSQKKDDQYTFKSPSSTNTENIIDESNINTEEKTNIVYTEETTTTSSFTNNHVPDYTIESIRSTPDSNIPFKANEPVSEDVVPAAEENITVENFQRKNKKNPKQEIAIFSENVALASDDYIEATDSTETQSDSVSDNNKIFTQYENTITPDSKSLKVTDKGKSLYGTDGRLRGEEKYEDANLKYNDEFTPSFDALQMIPPRQGLLDSIAMGLRTSGIFPSVPIPKIDSFNDTLLRIITRETFTQVGQIVFSRLHNSTLLGDNPGQAADIQTENAKPELSAAVKSASWIDGVINAVSTVNVDDALNVIGGMMGFRSPEGPELMRGFLPFMKNQIYRSAGHIFKDFYNYQLAVKIYANDYISRRSTVVQTEIKQKSGEKEKADAAIREMEEHWASYDSHNQSTHRSSQNEPTKEEIHKYNKLKSSSSWYASSIEQLGAENQALIDLKAWLIQFGDAFEYQMYSKDKVPNNIPYWHINMRRGKTGAVGEDDEQNANGGPTYSKFKDLNWRELAATTKPETTKDFEKDGWLDPKFNSNLAYQRNERENAYQEQDIFPDFISASMRDFAFTYLILNEDRYGKSYTSNLIKSRSTDKKGNVKKSDNSEPGNETPDTIEERNKYTNVEPYSSPDVMKSVYDKRNPFTPGEDLPISSSDLGDPHLLPKNPNNQLRIKDYFYKHLTDAKLIDEKGWMQSVDSESNDLLNKLSDRTDDHPGTHAAPDVNDTRTNITQTPINLNPVQNNLSQQLTETEVRINKVAQPVTHAVIAVTDNISPNNYTNSEPIINSTPIEIFTKDGDRKKQHLPGRTQFEIGYVTILGVNLKIPFQFNVEISGESKSANWNGINSFGRGSEFFVWANSSSRQLQFKTTYAIISDKNIDSTDINPLYSKLSEWDESTVLHYINLYRSMVHPVGDGMAPPQIKITLNEMTKTVNQGDISDSIWIVNQYDISPNLDVGHTKSMNPRIYDITLDLKETYSSWSGWQSAYSFINHKDTLNKSYPGTDKGKP